MSPLVELMRKNSVSSDGKRRKVRLSSASESEAVRDSTKAPVGALTAIVPSRWQGDLSSAKLSGSVSKEGTLSLASRMRSCRNMKTLRYHLAPLINWSMEFAVQSRRFPADFDINFIIYSVCSNQKKRKVLYPTVFFFALALHAH